MKEWMKSMQIGAVFVGSIVGAGLSSGRELNQFFGVYGYKSLIGILGCALSYIIIGNMIVDISYKYRPKSYDAFVELVCHKWIAKFTNVVLSLFLISSTSIILAGSSALIHEYFGIPKWIGFIIMIVCSMLFLFRSTKGLFEVNSVVVPCLLVVMSFIFIGFYLKKPELFQIENLSILPTKRQLFWPSSIIYAGFNIISIIGIIVPLAHEIRNPNRIKKGICIGTICLTVISIWITLLMIVNPTYPEQYEIPILAVAKQLGRWIPIGLMCIIWLELFSSQISNVYSLTKSLENRFKIPYDQGVWLMLLVSMPLSVIGFSRLVEFLYPIYGVLSLIFVGSCIQFYTKERIRGINFKKNKHRISPVHKI